MKFGETLYQRSIPQWAPYNVDYNSLKHLIKQRTTETSTEPVTIPGQGPSHDVWQPLDDELFPVLKQEHDRAALFIRSKLGEINRRLAHVERQASLTEKRTTTPTSRPIQQTRRYQKLVEEAESIGNDIEALSRFASVQRLAFRKILKKYRKWTGSSGLHILMNNEVLNRVPREDDEVLGKSRIALNPDMSPYLIRLNGATTNLQSAVDKQYTSQESLSSSTLLNAPEIAPSLTQFDFERGMIANPDSRAKSTYWIHNENLDEVKVLLMRRLKPWCANGGRRGSAPKSNTTNVLLVDDDSGLGKSENIAVARIVARWSDEDYAYIRERQDAKEILEEVRRKDLLKRLDEKTTPQFKQVALIKSTRELFSKDETDARLATLETNIQIGHFNHTSLEDAINHHKYPIHLVRFPFSVLTVCWVNSKVVPKLITTLDESHLVQLIPGFSLESHAMYTEVGHFQDPPWKSTLESDIRKVPAAIQKKRNVNRRQQSVTTSSGPSSTEGHDSIFSRSGHLSSHTSTDTSTEAFTPSSSSKPVHKPPTSAPEPSTPPRRKQKSYGAIQSEAPQRYWNEFDDEPEFNGEESYTIYVTPDEPFKFPGTDTISRAFGAMQASYKSSKLRILSWLPLTDRQRSTNAEQAGLFGHIDSPTETDRDLDVESSSDDNMPAKDAKRIASRHRGASINHAAFDEYSALGYPQRASRDRLLSHTSIGLHILSWMFLFMATVLKSTGRRKAAFQVDAAAISGILVALTCAIFSVGCTLVRRGHVSMAEWTIVTLLVLCEAVWGVCLGVWVAEGAA